MNNTILEEAKKVLAARKLKAESVANEIKLKAFQDEKFKEIYKDYISLMISSALDSSLVKDFKAKEKECNKRLQQLNLGSLTPVYSCPFCEDSGYVDGKICSCLKKEITKLLIKQSGFSKLEKFEECDFSRFDKPEVVKQIYDKMQLWCDQTKHAQTLIFLSGGTGVGKTHLIKCMADRLIQNGGLVNLVTAFALNQDLVKAYTTFDISLREQILDKYIGCEYLFIDDLGTEIKNRAITTSALYLVINERKMRGLATIITSNLNPIEIRDCYDERIASRIFDKESSICLQIKESDIRLKKR